VRSADRARLTLTTDALEPDRHATGDYHALLPGGLRLRIDAHTTGTLDLERPLAADEAPPPGSAVSILVRLQQPFVDPRRCIGCGICEHECPVLGLRAIRVTAENESRAEHHRMVL
jgi:hypothetical protein